MSLIQSFATAQGSPNQPTGLSFANVSYRPGSVNSVDPSAGWFGGLFGAAPCVDYWGARPDPTSLPVIGANQPLGNIDGEYAFTGNLTIGPTLIRAGKRLTVYIDGNVNIRGNIAYQNSAAWTSVADLPAFKLIVHGRIFIDSTVTQLDGVYVAVPNSGYVKAKNTFANPLAGTIADCSNGFSVIDPSKADTNDMVNTCGQQLTVNGSFVANQIFFLRTFGTLGNDQPAEVFTYNPEMWLAPSAGSTYDPEYRSVVGLPPVL
jgi:hypothetical protein